MRFIIQVVIEDDGQQTLIEDIVSFDKGSNNINCIGLSLAESKDALRNLQRLMVQSQALNFIDTNRPCPCCAKQRRIKGHHSIQYRTLFGIVVIESPRLAWQCREGS